ncbi:MAG: hypothetical protein MAG795_00992 [Candidatus Woesearchaeota archaeon]|nr:hypothetical protein [Candidatus Woesearchaeota archaeon]
MEKYAPLPGGFMAAAIIGLFVSGFYVIKHSKTWGFTFLLFFGILFIASLITMTYGPEEAMLKK